MVNSNSELKHTRTHKFLPHSLHPTPTSRPHRRELHNFLSNPSRLHAWNVNVIRRKTLTKSTLNKIAIASSDHASLLRLSCSRETFFQNPRAMSRDIAIGRSRSRPFVAPQVRWDIHRRHITLELQIRFSICIALRSKTVWFQSCIWDHNRFGTDTLNKHKSALGFFTRIALLLFLLILLLLESNSEFQWIFDLTKISAPVIQRIRYE